MRARGIFYIGLCCGYFSRVYYLRFQLNARSYVEAPPKMSSTYDWYAKSQVTRLLKWYRKAVYQFVTQKQNVFDEFALPMGMQILYRW